MVLSLLYFLFSERTQKVQLLREDNRILQVQDKAKGPHQDYPMLISHNTRRLWQEHQDN